MENRKRICAECSHWESGDFWFGSDGKHGVVIETKGWCMLKKNKRKRWNYHPPCESFEKAARTGFIYQGGGRPIEEDLRNITELMKDLTEKNTENND